jgi:hypothetical protein
MEDEEEQMRDSIASVYSLEATKENALLFDNVDSFVAQSRENTSVHVVQLYPFDSDAGDYEFWDKVGQIVGNCMELKLICIHFHPYPDGEDLYDGDEARVPDWEIITRILRYLRDKVTLCSWTEYYDAEVEEIQGLARAIRGHPMISEFSSEIDFTFANLGPWCSALATLPSLERLFIGLRGAETEDQHDLLNLEPLKELLRTRALRFVRFDHFHFTNELCYATANALEEGSSIIDINFGSGCSFPDGGRATIANALKTNLTVTDANFSGDFDESFCNALAAVLLCNSTLQNLTTVGRRARGTGRGFSSIFLSLGMNTTLKCLSVSVFDEFGDKLCAAIRNGLAKNSTLEELSLYNMIPSDDDGDVSARNALTFLRTNSTLKSLTVSFMRTQKESYYASAFRLEAVKMMKENPFIESLTIERSGRSIVKVEELLALISALQLNTTLKTLGLSTTLKNLGIQLDCLDHFSVDEVNQLVSILMKNYGLECLVPDIPCANDGTVKAILRLNRAGRRYLIKDGSSISKGVDVLSAVSDEIDCVFLHLLENPGLCDRRATETSSGRRGPAVNLDESSSTGKRERALSRPDKEHRRRLA